MVADGRGNHSRYEGRTSRSVRVLVRTHHPTLRCAAATRDGPVGPSEPLAGPEQVGVGVAATRDGPVGPSEPVVGHVPLDVQQAATRDGPVGPSELTQGYWGDAGYDAATRDGPVGPSEGPLRDPIRVKACATTLRAVRSTAGT